MKKQIAVIAILLTAWSADARDIRASIWALPCGTYWFAGCDAGEHKLPGGYSEYEYPHATYCSTCGFGDCHPVCGSGDDPETYSAILAAAQTGDVLTLVSLAPRSDGRISVNHKRQSLQILSCDRNYVIGNIPVAEDILVAAAAGLDS